MVTPNSEIRSEEVNEKTWYVLRIGKLAVVTLPGGAVRFRVQIGDGGREPFITQWFNDLAPAEDFRDRVMRENEALVRKHLSEVGNEQSIPFEDDGRPRSMAELAPAAPEEPEPRTARRTSKTRTTSRR